MRHVFMLAAAGFMLQACSSWVTLTPEGEKIRVLSGPEVTSCKKVGKTTSITKGDLAGLDRDPEEVRSELEKLARNNAPELNGDTVVPVGVPVDGKQVFEVYRCINPQGAN